MKLMVIFLLAFLFGKKSINGIAVIVYSLCVCSKQQIFIKSIKKLMSKYGFQEKNLSFA